MQRGFRFLDAEKGLLLFQVGGRGDDDDLLQAITEVVDRELRFTADLYRHGVLAMFGDQGDFGSAEKLLTKQGFILPDLGALFGLAQQIFC